MKEENKMKLLKEIFQSILHPIKKWDEWKYERYKKEFFTKRGYVESNKYHKIAKRVKA